MIDNDSSDDVVINLLAALLDEVITYGSKSSIILDNKKLTDEEMLTLAKTNMLFMSYSVLLLEILEQEKVDFARMVLKVWNSPEMKNPISKMFGFEIEQARKNIETGIEQLEKWANKEK